MRYSVFLNPGKELHIINLLLYYPQKGPQEVPQPIEKLYSYFPNATKIANLTRCSVLLIPRRALPSQGGPTHPTVGPFIPRWAHTIRGGPAHSKTGPTWARPLTSITRRAHVRAFPDSFSDQARLPAELKHVTLVRGRAFLALRWARPEAGP